MKYLFAVGLLVIGTIAAEKQYTVSHTKNEWILSVQAKAEVQRLIHKSNMPVIQADYCDSVLQADYMDVNRQVGAQIQADTTKPKKP